MYFSEPKTFDDMLDRSEICLEGQRDVNLNIPPLLHLHVLFFGRSRALIARRISFSETILSPGREYDFEAFFAFDLAPFAAARFTGVGFT